MYLTNQSISKSFFFEKFKVLILLSLSGVVLFFSTLQAPFLYDDSHSIIDNPYIKEISEFQEVIGIQNIFNRSILLLTFSLNYSIGEENVFGYHLFNIFLHICVGIIIYFLINELLSLEKQFIKLDNLPLLVSLIHIFNPMVVGSVTYISNRSSVLATLLYLLSFYCLVRFENQKENYKNKTDYIYYPLLAGAIFFLGLGVKEIIVTLPIVAVIYFWIKSSKKFTIYYKII